MKHTNLTDNRGTEIHIGDPILTVEDYAFYVKKVVARANNAYQVMAADSDGMCGMVYDADAVIVVDCDTDINLHSLSKSIKVGDEVAYPEYDDAAGVGKVVFVDQGSVVLHSTSGDSVSTSLYTAIPIAPIQCTRV